MATKHAQRHESEPERPSVYLLMIFMWAIFVLAFYLIWQKAAG